MSKDIDNEILRLEYLYKIGAKPAKSVKKDKTVYLNEYVHKKIAVYDGNVSSMIEEDLIKRLRADGLLPPPLVTMDGNKSGGGAQEYFNPATQQDTALPDHFLESPFKVDQDKLPTRKLPTKEASTKHTKPKPKK